MSETSMYEALNDRSIRADDGASQATVTPRVVIVLDELEKQIEATDAAFQHLAQQCDSVIRHEPMPTKKDAAFPESTVPLVARIERYSVRLQNLRVQMVELLEPMEI